MNSNNWLAFPLSPTHSSLPPHIHSSQTSHFNLGLVNDNMDNPFQNQGIRKCTFCFYTCPCKCEIPLFFEIYVNLVFIVIIRM